MTEWILLVLKWQSIFFLSIDPNFLLFVDQLDASPLEGKKKDILPHKLEDNQKSRKIKIIWGIYQERKDK